MFILWFESSVYTANVILWLDAQIAPQAHIQSEDDISSNRRLKSILTHFTFLKILPHSPSKKKVCK